MLVKTLAISLLCLAVNAGVPSDRTDPESEQLSRVLLCSCDTNANGIIDNSEIEGTCQKVLMGFKMTEQDIKEGQFSKLNMDIDTIENFQPPMEAALGGLEEIVRCSCDTDHDGEKKDGECTADELLDDIPVFNLVKLLFNLELTQTAIKDADQYFGNQNDKISANESIAFIKYVYGTAMKYDEYCTEFNSCT